MSACQTQVKICEPGGSGILLPLFGDEEQEWRKGLRAVLYLLGLLWLFMAVATVSDIFMGAIEEITSKKKRVLNAATGRHFTVKVWNDTVANLTLMALGSSAPEILLSVIELLGNSFYSGDLGPSTIVGSAAFNLFCISGVCVMAIPDNEVRYIKDTNVYLVTAVISLLAYLWLYLVVSVISQDMVDIFEGRKSHGGSCPTDPRHISCTVQE
ncbi:SLC8A1 [Symbiodinium necroappetens]|uniref:SLC8A1 protein n=1 Tax=Symbiodinium necroappetens TaxID=1628268 RepID=A0A812VMR4_9DINO|nr:SLC8A1 [Symbiodinium necroappetens]